MKPILECADLSKKYGSFLALNHLNLKVDPGQIVGLLGPNGSGKTTLIKLANGLLSPTTGKILIDGKEPGIETKSIVSYLPERTYLNNRMKITDAIRFFQDFYADFHADRAEKMIQDLNIDKTKSLGAMSKGTREKVQLILVMSRSAKLYLLDEPIGGVDPAARDYILNTIINNYETDSTILLSTHLISDIEKILDEVIFIQNGSLVLQSSVDDIREQHGKSVDTLFREVFKA